MEPTRSPSPRLPAWIRHTPLGGSTLGRLLDARARFLIEGGHDASGAAASLALVPQTVTARELMNGPMAAAAKQALAGIATVAADQARLAGTGDVDLRGVSLSSDVDGWAANKLVSMLETGAIATPASDTPQWRQLATGIFEDQRHRAQGGVTASYTRGWLDLGPVTATSLGMLLANLEPDQQRRGQLASTVAAHVLHEVGHSVTPAAPDERTTPSMRAFEEAVAEVMARWPGQVERAAATMGLPSDPSADAADGPLRLSGYDIPAASLAEVLALVGLDPRDPQDVGSAASLLQSTPSPAALDRLVDAVVQRSPAASADSGRVRELVLTAMSDPAAVAALQQLLATTAPAADPVVAQESQKGSIAPVTAPATAPPNIPSTALRT